LPKHTDIREPSDISIDFSEETAGFGRIQGPWSRQNASTTLKVMC